MARKRIGAAYLTGAAKEIMATQLCVECAEREGADPAQIAQKRREHQIALAVFRGLAEAVTKGRTVLVDMDAVVNAAHEAVDFAEEC
jgi:hypothetical protein